MAIKEVRCNTWDEFEGHIKKDYKLLEIAKKSDLELYPSDILYRGHRSASWKLETTLQRFTNATSCIEKEFTEANYHHVMRILEQYICSLTSNRFMVGEHVDRPTRLGPPTSYELMIYLRHHGFPSPLMDWSKSPYVAAYFAFEAAQNGQDVAIFAFQEYGTTGKLSTPNEPTIEVYGPTVTTHARHYLQQCQYTVCYKCHQSDKIYCSHEEATFQTDQDILTKYTMPSSERKYVLKRLDLMNVNAFSLFANEEGLASMLAFRILECDMR